MSQIAIDKILDHAISAQASRIELNVGSKPTLIVAGRHQDAKDVIVVDGPENQPPICEGTKILDSGDMADLMKSITPERHGEQLKDTGATKFGFAYGDTARFITGISRQKGDLTMTFKRVDADIKTFDDLGISKPMFELLRGRKDGLIVVASPQGHGRSTLIASIIDYYNTEFRTTIATIEDPIEHMHASKKAIVRQHEIGNDVFGYDTPAIALCHPKIVYFGDDINTNPDVQSAAMDAINAGALVLATYKGMTMDSGQIREDIAEKIGASLGSGAKLAFLQSAYSAITQHIEHGNTSSKVSCTVSHAYEKNTTDGTYIKDQQDFPFMGKWAGPKPA